MRLIKKYESFFDPDQSVVEIARKYSTEDVLDKISVEAQAWSDSYGDHGNGEAEEQVLADMISWWEKKSGKSLDEQQYASLEDALRTHYSI